MPDNGIKLFAAGGHKLPDDVEDQIEASIAAPWSRPVGRRVGRVSDNQDGLPRYVDHLVRAVPGGLDGIRVVVDCANGAASAAAPEAYRRAGADVVAIAAEPDGWNINDGCGSTHLDGLRAAVVEHGADLGVAHDGDADRCLAVTATGDDIDGDHILAILAFAMREAGTLAAGTVVATVMSNLGLKLALSGAGIAMVETKVGDRYVLEELRARGLALGGEQSGHIVVPALSTTGDGVLTALLLMARMAATGKDLAELASVVQRLPQVLVNVAVADRAAGSGAPDVLAAVRAVETELDGSGRVLLRPSGTEPLVRVMVEAGDEELARQAAHRIASVVRAASPPGG
jgi:phosphoglucosamine mutase